MNISGRNKLPGVIKGVTIGTVMTEVVIEIGSHQVVAVITRGSAEELGLKAGDNVTALIKATSVMVIK